MTMECFVCCEEKSESEFYHCKNKECTFTACIDCNKKYLLSCIQDEHCMNCKTVIPYDDFLGNFDKSWVFTKYKKHKENVLIEIEKVRFKEDMAEIAANRRVNEISKEIAEKYREYRQSIVHLELEKQELRKPKNRIKYISNYQCASEECNGFLDKDFKCGLCNTQTCKKCYTVINKDEIHECNEEQIETFNKIKEESKTCPKCGEFISKISGCDQMFCVSCGTAFSWKTGQIEKGVVHNPHAHQFFENNPQLGEIYRNNINGQNGCRMAYLPPLSMLYDKFDPSPEQRVILGNIGNIHRTVAEFRQYYRDRYTDKIENPMRNDVNKDYRIKRLNNTINDKKFKQMVHMRYKKHNYMRQVCILIRSEFEIIELMLWEIANSSLENYVNEINPNELLYESNKKIYDGIDSLRKQTNDDLYKLSNMFGYSSFITLNCNMRGFPYSF